MLAHFYTTFYITTKLARYVSTPSNCCSNIMLHGMICYSQVSTLCQHAITPLHQYCVTTILSPNFYQQVDVLSQHAIRPLYQCCVTTNLHDMFPPSQHVMLARHHTTTPILCYTAYHTPLVGQGYRALIRPSKHTQAMCASEIN